MLLPSPFTWEFKGVPVEDKLQDFIHIFQPREGLCHAVKSFQDVHKPAGERHVIQSTARNTAATAAVTVVVYGVPWRGHNPIIMKLHNYLWSSIIRIMELHNSNDGAP